MNAAAFPEGGRADGAGGHRMTDVDELLAVHGVQQTVLRYARAADRGRAADLAAQFLPDGVLHIIGNTFDAGEYLGREAILARIEQSVRDLAATGDTPVLRHHISTVLVEPTGPDEARSSAYFLAVTAGGPDHWGRYRDTLRRVGGRWFFVRRECRHEGFGAGSWIEGALDRLRA